MRRIAGKYMTDGNLTKVDGTPIPEDEPLMLFRAQDKLLAETLDFYRELRVKAATSAEGLAVLDQEIALVKEWQAKHPERVQLPK